MRKCLTLTKETLTELASDDLVAVVGAAIGTNVSDGSCVCNITKALVIGYSAQTSCTAV